MNARLFILIAGFLFSTCTFGQSWVTTIDSLFEESTYDIIELPDESIFFVGTICVSPVADPCQQLIYGKLNSNGQILWFKHSILYQYPIDVTYFQGNCYILVGNSVFGSYTNSFLIVVNQTGEIIQTKPLGDIFTTSWAFDMNEFGEIYLASNQRVIQKVIQKLSKYDNQLNLIWEKQLDTTASSLYKFDVRVLNSQKIQCISARPDSVHLEIFDSSGIQTAFYPISTPVNSIYQQFLQAADEGYFLCTQKSGGNNLENFNVKRIDEFGTEIWNKTLFSAPILYYTLLAERTTGKLQMIGLSDTTTFFANFSQNGQLLNVDNLDFPSDIPYFQTIKGIKNDKVAAGGSFGAFKIEIDSISGQPLSSTSKLFITKWDSIPVSFNKLVFGNIFWDENQSCVKNAGEIGFKNAIIEAKGNAGTFYNSTNNDGSYELVLPDGVFLIKTVALNPYFSACVDSQNVVLTHQNDSILLDFGLKTVIDCPYLTTDLTIPRLRRCFNAPATIETCNLGTTITDTAWLDVKIGPFLTISSADYPFSTLGIGHYRFDLDTLAPFQCKTIHLQIMTDCDSATLGQTHCLEVHAFPDTICVPTDPTWTGASIELDARCTADSVHFSIENVGNGATSAPVDFIVIEDDVILHVGQQPTLAPGQTVAFSYAADGHFWRLESTQEPGHPFGSMPSVNLEGCAGFWPNSFGFWQQFSSDDALLSVDIDCLQNVGSFDPNDKTGSPQGVDNQHFIHKNQDIEYVIRFQNTGTDTAFTVVLRDTLDQNLDIARLKIGAASHPFLWKISGQGALEIRFENILLPDSTTNLAASQGFISMQIPQQIDLADGSQIRNQAAIYFDFNLPIFTNQTLHTIGTNFLTLQTWSPTNPVFSLKVFPNPTSETAHFELQNMDNQPITLKMYALDGREVRTVFSEKSSFDVARDGLASGFYFFKILGRNGRILGAGKLIIN
jgi:uncharacterized repeat protein (TIGR01451 family)